MTTAAQQRRAGEGTGSSTARDAATAGREAVLAALGGVPAGPEDLVMVFAKAAYDLEALSEAAVAAAAPAPVVGATTVGAFTTTQQVADGCVALVLRGGDDTRFGVCHVDRDDGDIAGTARRAAECARDRAGAEREHSVLMLLCDGLTPDQREMARGAYEVTSALVPLVGAAAGDDYRWQATSTFGEERVSTRGLVTVWITSDHPLAVAVDHGWSTYGKPMLVTKAEGTVIVELDGRPAVEAYLAERGAPLRPGPNFGAQALDRPLGIPNGTGGHDLRQVNVVTPQQGLNLTTTVPEQTVVRIMAADPDGLLAGAGRAAQSALAALDGRTPQLAVVFSCCTRGALIRERISEEIGVISQALGGVPAAGFYGYSEFARTWGTAGIHNSSVALLCL